MEQNILQIIQTVGFPIFCVLACGYFIYKMWTRSADENIEREKSLISNNAKIAESLDKVADTIIETNKINSDLVKANNELGISLKISTGKVNDKLVDLENDINDIKEAISKKD